MTPRVSVIMPSYNHDAFIKQAIDSVLLQTFSDFELLVIDDGSLDGSRGVIKGIVNPKLVPYFLEKNVGACEATNIGIRLAKGEYIAICNSDDMWEREKLQLQVEFLDNHKEVGAIFSDVSWIDNDGKPIAKTNLPNFSSIFSQQNRSRFAWQRKLIENGNCLCHPSVLIRKSAYEKVGLYNNLLRQLPDFDMWLRLLTKHEIHITSEKLIRFRIHDGNTSKQTEAADIRTWAEHTLIARSFFSNLDYENFFAAFGVKEILDLNFTNEAQLRNEKISYLLGHVGVFDAVFKRLALEMVYDLQMSGEPGCLDALEFQALTGNAQSGFNRMKAKQERSIWLLEALRRLNRARLGRRRARRSKT